MKKLITSLSFLIKGILIALTINIYSSLMVRYKYLIGISPKLIRVASIFIIISGILFIYNISHIQSVGSEISDYSGYYQVTVLSYGSGLKRNIITLCSSIIKRFSSGSPQGIKILTSVTDEGNMLNILTLDLETRTLSNGEFEVISSALYDGNGYQTFIVGDEGKENTVIKDTVKFLTELPQGYNIENCVYIHNSSSFDMVFLFSELIDLKTKGYKIKIIKREDKFISLTISKERWDTYTSISGKDKKINSLEFKLTFYDSLLLLPSSLQKLSKSFNVEGKLDFNVLDNNNADLSDPIFRENLLAYNKQDCKALYEVLYHFNQNIKDLFEIEIWKVPTLPSLSYRIYRKHHIGENQIPITTLDIYKDISQGYRGGATDMYRPYIKDAWYYDVNSLYPHVMEDNLYPVGDTCKFTGERKLSDTFGIVYCEVHCPNNLYAPILLTKTVDGRILAGTGSWKGWYVTEELKQAEEFGYKVKILKGYYWKDKNYIFSSFVSVLYNLRLSFIKSDPRNMICKFIMNSLYGKFGMSPKLTEYVIKEKSPDKIK